MWPLRNRLPLLITSKECARQSIVWNLELQLARISTNSAVHVDWYHDLAAPHTSSRCWQPLHKSSYQNGGWWASYCVSVHLVVRLEPIQHPLIQNIFICTQSDMDARMLYKYCHFWILHLPTLTFYIDSSLFSPCNQLTNIVLFGQESILWKFSDWIFYKHVLFLEIYFRWFSS